MKEKKYNIKVFMDNELKEVFQSKCKKNGVRMSEKIRDLIRQDLMEPNPFDEMKKYWSKSD